MNDSDRWGEDRGRPLIRPRDRRRFNPILAGAMLLLGVVILFPAGRVVYQVLSGHSLFSGSGYAKVSGIVKYKGTPLASGKICFIGKEGTEPAMGEIMDDGSYTVQAAPIGDTVVTVITESASTAGPNNPVSKKPVVTAPVTYRSTETSPLRFTVKKGKNIFDIELTD